VTRATEPASVDQDLAESISRTISFANDLNGSTISSVAWALWPPGLTLAASSNTTTTATFRVTATASGTYVVTCTATLANAEVLRTQTTVVVT
jgi:hypothetical protein